MEWVEKVKFRILFCILKTPLHIHKRYIEILQSLIPLKIFFRATTTNSQLLAEFLRYGEIPRNYVPSAKIKVHISKI